MNKEIEMLAEGNASSPLFAQALSMSPLLVDWCRTKIVQDDSDAFCNIMQFVIQRRNQYHEFDLVTKSFSLILTQFNNASFKYPKAATTIVKYAPGLLVDTMKACPLFIEKILCTPSQQYNEMISKSVVASTIASYMRNKKDFSHLSEQSIERIIPHLKIHNHLVASIMHLDNAYDLINHFGYDKIINGKPYAMKSPGKLIIELSTLGECITKPRMKNLYNFTRRLYVPHTITDPIEIEIIRSDLDDDEIVDTVRLLASHNLPEAITDIIRLYFRPNLSLKITDSIIESLSSKLEVPSIRGHTLARLDVNSIDAYINTSRYWLIKNLKNVLYSVDLHDQISIAPTKQCNRDFVNETFVKEYEKEVIEERPVKQCNKEVVDERPAKQCNNQEKTVKVPSISFGESKKLIDSYINHNAPIKDILTYINEIQHDQYTKMSLIDYLNTLAEKFNDKLVVLLLKTMLFDDALLQKMLKYLLECSLNDTTVYLSEIMEISNILYPLDQDVCLKEIAMLAARCRFSFLLDSLMRSSNLKTSDDLFGIVFSFDDKLYDRMIFSME